MTDRKSWDRVPFWVKELKEHEPNCALYICGTKEDLLESHERGLDELVVQRFCVDNNAQYFETSSRTGSNVDALFRAIAEHYTRDTPGHGSTDSPWASSSEAVQGSGTGETERIEATNEAMLTPLVVCVWLVAGMRRRGRARKGPAKDELLFVRHMHASLCSPVAR